MIKGKISVFGTVVCAYSEKDVEKKFKNKYLICFTVFLKYIPERIFGEIFKDFYLLKSLKKSFQRVL